MDTDALRWLQQVADGTTLTEVSELESVTQSGVSRALARLEAQIGTRYTYETIAYLLRHCPGVRFVWIMGADNLRSFHRWQKWRGIAEIGRAHV